MNDSTNGYAGVDWATDAHAVCVVDEKGQVIVEFVAHTADGFAELCRRVGKTGARRGGHRTSRRSRDRRPAWRWP